MTIRHRRENSLKKSIAFLSNRIRELESLNNRYAWYRLGIFLGGLGVSILLYFANALAGWLLFSISLIAFNVIAYHHRRINRSLKKHQLWKAIKETQLARMNLDWENIPSSEFRSGERDHPFEIDLDITGRHSLMQLLDITFSREGERLLGKWLLKRLPEIKEIQRRQAIVRELSGLPGFRDKLLLNFSLVSEDQLEGKRFFEKISRRADPVPAWVIPISLLFSISTIALFILSTMGALPGYYVLSFLLYAFIYYGNQNAIKHIFSDVLFLEEELGKVEAILNFLESYPYEKNANLAALCSPFTIPDNKPSVHLKRIKRIMIAIGLRMNPAMMILLNLLVPWDFYFARRLENAKKELAARLPDWLHVWAELEAMISLANFAWLNPENTFPELVQEKEDKQSAATFETRQLGHPLIPFSQRIDNDYTLAQSNGMMLITGSNMAGKSTFLKSLGVNLLLAFAGGAVTASHFKTTLYRVFAGIKVAASVTDGFSYFYAEVRRLKALLNALETQNEYPVFFLIDEIFRGTNNRERYLGSKAYIIGMAGKNGVGAISTHDLELTRLTEDIPELANYHFREEVANGKMVFDYLLRSGPCPTTNALTIMKMEGLPVDFPREK